MVFSVFAICYISNKINVEKTWTYFLDSDFSWLLAALICFNLSKIISAFRLNEFFSAINLHISDFLNLKLYYIGMFYNLFLPGGIGGDGYKVYLLNKYHKTPVKQLVSAELLDRSSGMAALVTLALLSVLQSTALKSFTRYTLLIYLALLLIYPAFLLVVKSLFKIFEKKFLRVNFLSFSVQAIQVIAVLCILSAFGVKHNYSEYIVLFLVSSAASIVPVSVGGFGLRELVFITGSHYLETDADIGVAIGLMFFVITAISSFIGIALSYQPRK